MLRQYQFALITLTAFTFTLLTACGSGNKTVPPPTVLKFTSTPVTQAVEGTVYSYQLVTTDSNATFALATAPSGATLSGNTISWTPTAAQSRASNSFTATATTPGGTSATQSWTVTPNGTVRIIRVDTLWDETGSTDKPLDWSGIASSVAALIPQPDGSFKSLSGTPGTNGVFEITNVPAGYYWFQLGPQTFYWTSSATLDLGTDYFASRANATTPADSTTTFNFSFTSLEAAATKSSLLFTTPGSLQPSYSGTIAAGSTIFTGSMVLNGNLDFSGIKNAFVMQYKPTTLGYLNGQLLGPELTLTNMSLTTGGVNTISGALNPAVPASLQLSVQASAWIPLLDHIAPTAPTAVGGGFYASVHPYSAAGSPYSQRMAGPINLIATMPDATPAFLFNQANCSGMSPSAETSGGFSTVTTLQPMMTDVEAGTVQYSDPFPAAWRRTFSVCQNASVDVPLPEAGATQSIVLINSQTTSLPTETVKPLISPAQNPKINGADLFTASTINTSAVTLGWSSPAIGAPFGYQVTIETSKKVLGHFANYSLVATLNTATTSIKIPPGLLASGHTYLFIISSLADGKANMETSPNRSLLPVARADLISAPLTIAAAQSN